MNILLITHERNLGGASKSLVTLACELKERGHQVTVILPIKTGQVYPKLKQKGIPVKRIFFGWWMCPMEWNDFFKLAFRMLHGMEWIAACRIAAYAKKYGVQMIHSNSSAIDVGALAAKKAGVPHVWHFREFGDLDYRLEYMLGRQQSCQMINEMSDRMVFISQNLYQYYADSLEKEKCRVIYNGISEDYLYAKNENEGYNRSGEIIFLIAGNLHRNKKQDVAVKAAEILKQRGHEGFRLLIAGAASSMADSRTFEKELWEQAQEIGSETVQFLGFIGDMPELRKKADVELVCSGREAFGRVTVEAMMCSNPVIASDTGANPELIREGENGFLFREGDAASLADQMEKFIQNRELLVTMGAKAYAFAKENFLSEINTAHIERLYEELLTD